MLESILFWNIFNFLITFLEYVPLKIILDESCELKDNVHVSNKLILNLNLILIIVISTLFTIFNLNAFVKFMLSMLIMFSFCKMNYKINVSKAIFITIAYSLLVICLETVSIGLIMLINSSNYIPEVLSHNYMEFEVAIISKFTLLLVIPVVKGINIKKKKLEKEYIFLIIPIAINLIAILVIFKIVFVMKLSKENVIVITSLGVLIATNIICLVFNIWIFRINKIKMVSKLILERTKIIDQYYSELENYIPDTKICFDTKNRMLDIILSNKKQICDEERIVLHADIDFSPCRFICISDICNIFSNLIDNSIDLCKLVECNKCAKMIKITGKACGASNKMYVLKVESSKLFELVKKEELIDDIEKNVHNKNSQTNNIYINSVKKCLKKYNADIVVQSEKNELRVLVMFGDLTQIIYDNI